MQKALSEFLSLQEAEILQLTDTGPILVTHEGEPRIVAQAIADFERMVRRLRQLESTRRHPPRLASVIPIRPFRS